jgi:hypothetical protein
MDWSRPAAAAEPDSCPDGQPEAGTHGSAGVRPSAGVCPTRASGAAGSQGKAQRVRMARKELPSEVADSEAEQRTDERAVDRQHPSADRSINGRRHAHSLTQLTP